MTEAYGNAWIMTPHKSIVCEINGEKCEVEAIEETSIYQVIEFSKEWVQTVQLMSLKTNPGPIAKQALELMMKHRERLQN